MSSESGQKSGVGATKARFAEPEREGFSRANDVRLKGSLSRNVHWHAVG